MYKTIKKERFPMSNMHLEILARLDDLMSYVSKNPSNTIYEDMLEHVEKEIEEIKRQASQNNVPLIITAKQIMHMFNIEGDSFSEEPESSSYVEPESSSYYEEPESSEYEETSDSW